MINKKILIIPIYIIIMLIVLGIGFSETSINIECKNKIVTPNNPTERPDCEIIKDQTVAGSQANTYYFNTLTINKGVSLKVISSAPLSGEYCDCNGGTGGYKDKHGFDFAYGGNGGKGGAPLFKGQSGENGEGRTWYKGGRGGNPAGIAGGYLEIIAETVNLNGVIDASSPNGGNGIDGRGVWFWPAHKETGAGGGAGGSGGGIISITANTFNQGSNGLIDVHGGAGGAGGAGHADPGNDDGGAGGGGAGGAGGFIYLQYQQGTDLGNVKINRGGGSGGPGGPCYPQSCDELEEDCFWTENGYFRYCDTHRGAIPNGADGSKGTDGALNPSIQEQKKVLQQIAICTDKAQLNFTEASGLSKPAQIWSKKGCGDCYHETRSCNPFNNAIKAEISVNPTKYTYVETYPNNPANPIGTVITGGKDLPINYCSDYHLIPLRYIESNDWPPSNKVYIEKTQTFETVDGVDYRVIRFSLKQHNSFEAYLYETLDTHELKKVKYELDDTSVNEGGFEWQLVCEIGEPDELEVFCRAPSIWNPDAEEGHKCCGDDGSDDYGYVAPANNKICGEDSQWHNYIGYHIFSFSQSGFDTVSHCDSSNKWALCAAGLSASGTDTVTRASGFTEKDVTEDGKADHYFVYDGQTLKSFAACTTGTVTSGTPPGGEIVTNGAAEIIPISKVGKEDYNRDGIVNENDGDANGDVDNDGVLNGADNCPSVPNGDCFAANGDILPAIQYKCDSNGDGTVSTKETLFAKQRDSDSDGIGDACDDYINENQFVCGARSLTYASFLCYKQDNYGLFAECDGCVLDNTLPNIEKSRRVGEPAYSIYDYTPYNIISETTNINTNYVLKAGFQYSTGLEYNYVLGPDKIKIKDWTNFNSLDFYIYLVKPELHLRFLDSTEKELATIPNILDYSINCPKDSCQDKVNRWHHISIPLGILPTRNDISLIGFYANDNEYSDKTIIFSKFEGSPITEFMNIFYLDRLFLVHSTTNRNRYCTSDATWIQTPDFDNNANICDEQPGYHYVNNKCCGDAVGEHYKQAVSILGDNAKACCDSKDKCVDKTGTCIAEGYSADKNYYCQNGNWIDLDTNQQICEGLKVNGNSIYRWLTKDNNNFCCGDDSNEFYKDATALFGAKAIACLASNQCVGSDGAPVDSGQYADNPENKKYYCDNGNWVDLDTRKDICEGTTTTTGLKWSESFKCCGNDPNDNGKIDDLKKEICYEKEDNTWDYYKASNYKKGNVTYVNSADKEYLSTGAEWRFCADEQIGEAISITKTKTHEYLCRAANGQASIVECCGSDSCFSGEPYGLRKKVGDVVDNYIVEDYLVPPKYCTPKYTWIKNLDENKETCIKAETNEAGISYAWTGLKCCGDDKSDTEDVDEDGDLTDTYSDISGEGLACYEGQLMTNCNIDKPEASSRKEINPKIIRVVNHDGTLYGDISLSNAITQPEYCSFKCSNDIKGLTGHPYTYTPTKDGGIWKQGPHTSLKSTPNYVKNGGFNFDANGLADSWYIYDGGVVSSVTPEIDKIKATTKSQKVPATASIAGIYQEPFTRDEKCDKSYNYILSAKIYVESGKVEVGYESGSGSSEGKNKQVFEPLSLNKWQNVLITGTIDCSVTLHADTGIYSVYFYSTSDSTNGATFYVDDVSFVLGTKNIPYNENCCQATQCWDGTTCDKIYFGETHICLNGVWQPIVSKASFTGQTGFCAASQCYAGNVNKATLKDSAELCVESGTYISATEYSIDNLDKGKGDHYCENGQWTTRTKLIALNLLGLVDANDYELICGPADYSINSPEAYGSIFKENNFCVLNTNNKIFFGTYLNDFPNQPSIKEVEDLLIGVKDYCSNVASDKNIFIKCNNDNKLWFNPILNVIIYVKQGENPKPSATETKITTNIPPVTSLTGVPLQYNQIYSRKKSGKEIYGIFENNKIAVSYKGFGINNLCSHITNNKVDCTQTSSYDVDGTTRYDYSITTDDTKIPEDEQKEVWLDLTSRLRIGD